MHISANKVTLTQEELTKTKSAIETTLYRYSHAKEYDFASEITGTIQALAHCWFSEITEHDVESKAINRKMTNPIYIKLRDRALITSVFDKVFNVRVTFTEQNSLSKLLDCCTTSRKKQKDLSVKVIPEGLDMPVEDKNLPSIKYDVTLTWNPNNHFINQVRKPLPLPSSDAALVFKEESLNTPVKPDFTLKVGEQSFPVHKFQLATHSGYFLGLFRSDFEEAASQELEIKNYEPRIVKMLIDYIYSGTLDTLGEATADDLLALTKLANGCEVKSCVKACETALCKHVKDNFEDIYKVALLLKLENLLKFCLQFADSEAHLKVIRTNTTVDNIGPLLQIAHDNNLMVALNEFKGWEKYNQAAQNIEIVIEPAVVENQD